MLEDRWFRPSFCGHGSASDHILCTLHNLFELAVGLVCIFSKEHPVNLLSSLSLSCSISTSICLIKKRSKWINCS